MRINARLRQQLRYQSIIFVVLLLGIVVLLAWLSRLYSFEADWTSSGRNSLSEASARLLDTIAEEIRITAYADENEQLRTGIKELVGRYQRHRSDITLEFVNPEREPELAKRLNIRAGGELFITIGERQERLVNLSEETLTNALHRLSRGENHWLVFLEGHGERRINGQANHDLLSWGSQLEQKGFKTQSLNLSSTTAIPANTRVLVIASPQTPYLPGEAAIIQKFVQDGGNLLWLLEPGEPLGELRAIAENLGFELHPGVIVDPTTQLFGINDPRFALVTEYLLHPVTRDFGLMTLFPQTAGLEPVENADWTVEGFLNTVERSWSETGPLDSQIEFDEGEDIPGPLIIGLSFTRERGAEAMDQGGEQRVAVIGDGDFLANSYVGNGGNMDLGMHLINWLSQDDNLIAIPSTTRKDVFLELPPWAQYVIGFGFLLGLPLILAGTGITIWLRRRKR